MAKKRQLNEKTLHFCLDKALTLLDEAERMCKDYNVFGDPVAREAHVGGAQVMSYLADSYIELVNICAKQDKENDFREVYEAIRRSYLNRPIAESLGDCA